MRKVIVAGAGASGLLAAGRAASLGAEVLLLEKMKYPALKLRITGKGRCNLTNVADLELFLEQFGKNGRFLRSAFSRFFVPELIGFLAELGIELETQRGGRVFPASGSAPQVAAELVRWVLSRGVTLRTASPAASLLLEKGKCRGVATAGGEEIRADATILAMGGASYPATGSDGDGFRLAGAVGHTIVEPRPALIPLEIDPGVRALLAGLELRNINVTMLVDGKKKREEFGEMLFAEFGISGPTVLRLSGTAVDALRAGRRVEFSIDLKPALDERKLEARLLRDLEARGSETISDILRGLLPREMVPVCLEYASIDPTVAGNQLTTSSRKVIRAWLKDFRLEISGFRPLAEAIVTAGGVSLKEVNPASLESRLVENLYICGEMLDLQANTGGYNLQAAFSTGWLAGESAAASRGKPE